MYICLCTIYNECPTTLRSDNCFGPPVGVPILHLIVVPFPKVWHTMEDNMDNIDGNVSKDIIGVVKAFVVEYMQLSV